jgi:hypothetical protein
VSQRLVQDLVTGVERKFTPAICLALDAALALPAGTVSRSVREKTARPIRQAPYPQSHREWLVNVLAEGGCMTSSGDILKAAHSLLRNPDPAMRDLALAAMAVVRELPAEDWREKFGRELAGRDGLTSADRIVFGAAADRRADRLRKDGAGSVTPVSGQA